MYHHTCRQMFCLQADLDAVVCNKRNFLPDLFYYSYPTKAVKKLFKKGCAVCRRVNYLFYVVPLLFNLSAGLDANV